MRHVLFIIAMLWLTAGSICIHGQTYHLTVTSQPFEPLTKGTLLVNETWDDVAFEVPLGFEFQFFDETITHLYSADFYAGGYVTSSLSLDSTNVLIGMGQDITDRGYAIDSFMSPISYQTSGSPGNKITILEYTNAGFYAGELVNGIRTDYTNFQIKLFEATGDIEVHIGPHQVTNVDIDFEGLGGPSMGFVEGFSFNKLQDLGEIFVLAGDPLHPDILTSPKEEGYLQWPIPENTLYRFSRNPNGVFPEGSTINVNYFYPNPASEIIYCKGNLPRISQIEVYNAVGNTVLRQSNTNPINVRDWRSGVYIIKTIADNGMAIQQMLITH
jgi:hypothetical protein